MNCPECGKRVLMIYHEWNDKVLFEYHHEDDPMKEVPTLCTVLIPREQAQIQYKKEWNEMNG
jgi:hypothetical protein